MCESYEPQKHDTPGYVSQRLGDIDNTKSANKSPEGQNWNYLLLMAAAKEVEMTTRSGGKDDAGEEPIAGKQVDYWQTADCHRVTFFWVAISWQTLMLILYAFLTDYSDLAKVLRVGSYCIRESYPSFSA